MILGPMLLIFMLIVYHIMPRKQMLLYADDQVQLLLPEAGGAIAQIHYFDRALIRFQYVAFGLLRSFHITSTWQ